MDRTENLMTIRALTKNGWTKLNGKHRTIKIGNVRNCNDDGMICDPNIKNKMENFMKKYDIKEYQIEEHINPMEFSYELILDEEQYNNLKCKLSE